MTEFKKGQRVHISEFTGVISSVSDNTLLVRHDGPYRERYLSWIPKDLATVTAPANWPPQVGDIWEVDGSELFAVEYPRYTSRIRMIRDSSGFIMSPEEMKESGNPVLVRRRGE